MKKAAAYVRMSTDKQEDSPARQRGEIERYAAAQGYEIVEWYEDHGITGTTSKKRKGFQKLLADAKAGRWQFVLMYEQSRFSRENPLQFLTHLCELTDAGVKLATVLEGVIDPSSIGGLLQTVIKSHTAREESVTLAQRSASGRRRKIIEQGETFAQPTFGFDRVIIDQTGEEIARVHFGQRYMRNKMQRVRLEPSTDAQAVEAVRWAFDAVLSGQSITNIARHFNDLGIQTPYQNAFRRRTILYMLTNPVYCGRARLGKYANGKFARVTDEVITIEEAHTGIVTPGIFDAAQTVIDGKRADRRLVRDHSHYLLTGKLFCGRCGTRMTGGASRRDLYRCMDRDFNPHTGSCQVAVKARYLETAIWALVQSHILTDANLRDAEDAYQNQSTTADPQLAARVDELKAKIDRATERLAGDDLDTEQLGAVSRQWREWKKELKALQRSIIEVPESPVAASMKELRAQVAALSIDDHPAQLRVMLQAMLENVTFHRESRRDFSLKVEFNPDIYFGAPIVLQRADIIGTRKWEDVCEFVKQAGPVRCCEVARQFNVTGGQAHQALKVGIRKGLIQRRGSTYC